MIKLQTIVNGLIKEGYKELGGSDVFRMLTGPFGESIKVYYDDYKELNYIIVRQVYFDVKVAEKLQSNELLKKGVDYERRIKTNDRCKI